MRLSLILFLVYTVINLNGFSQTDSTDLTLTVDSVVLATSMDSIIFGNGGYDSYHLEFTVSDTVNFGEVLINISSDGNVINKFSKTLVELQSDSLIDSNWLIDINFGNFESTFDYKIALVIKDYAGISSAPIVKHF